MDKFNFENFKHSSIFKCLSDEINMSLLPGICAREAKDLTVVNYMCKFSGLSNFNSTTPGLA